MIKKIKIKDLLKEKRNLEWNIDGFKFLYGQNGTGKTTLLDSVYYALTNDSEIFMEINEQGQRITRKIPYSKLIITIDNGNITILGNSGNEKLSYQLEHIHKINKDENYVTSLREKIRIFLSTINNLLINNIKEFKNIAADHIEVTNYLESKSENEGLNQVKANLMFEIKSIYSQLINEQTTNERQQFIKKYDVLYLTTYRMTPDILPQYKHNNVNIFKRPRKYLLVKTRHDIMNDFNNELIKFRSSINTWTFTNFKTLLENEWEQSPKNNDKIFLNPEKKEIWKIILQYLGMNKEFIDRFDLNSVDKKDKRFSWELINSINNMDNNLSKHILKMISFIDDINDFFKTNNKKIVWVDKLLPPKIEDKNNPGQDIYNYPFSSGENQIINILFNIHFFKKEKLLILADEIELSLAPDWQEMLYEKIKLQVNKKRIELIGVTHSPFVVSEEDLSKRLAAFENESD